MVIYMLMILPVQCLLTGMVSMVKLLVLVTVLSGMMILETWILIKDVAGTGTLTDVDGVTYSS